MLTALHLGNFKAFAETQRIPIHPLTLIFGANSSGKSSTIHGLLLAHHALETGELDAYRTTIGGDSVDLGGFHQYIHRREAEQRHLMWGVELDLRRASVHGRLAELLAPATDIKVMLTMGLEHTQRLPQTTLMSYVIDVDGLPLLQSSRRTDGSLRCDALHYEHPLLQTIVSTMVEMASPHGTPTAQEYAGLNDAINQLVPHLTLPRGKFFPSGLAHGNQVFPQQTRMRMFPVRTGNQQEDLTTAVQLFLPHMLNDLIQGINDLVTTWLRRLSYLGPLRSYPPRAAAFSQHYDPTWVAGGGYTWDVLRREDQARQAVNRWLTNPDRLKTPYELKVRELVSLHDLVELLHSPQTDHATLSDDAQSIANFIQEHIYRTPLSYLNELILVDRRSNTTVSHRDIGFGISQVLPVLVSAFAATSSLIAIEQPEIHLHPALQAELGDVFIESALGNRQNVFLLETHSEHLILRLMRRMRDTVRGTLPEGIPPITPDDVAILYVQPGDSDSAAVVQQLELDADGELLDPWPGGFFEEGFNERFG